MKKTMVRLFAVTAIVLTLGATAFAGGKKDAGTSAPAGVEYETVLNVAVYQESPSLDLHKNSSLIARQIGSGSIWEKLVTLNSQSEAVPELAERFEISSDGKTFTFYLRKGVKFHDGSIMSADDVTASINRWIESYSAAKSSAGNARFQKIDDSTVTISFDHPSVTFIDMLAGAAQPAVITTVAATKDLDDNGFMRQNIGTGPFKFVEWKLSQYILIEKFADYVPYGDPSKPIDGWAGYKAPKLEQIYFHLVPQASTRLAGLETGQYQVNYNVNDDDLPRINTMQDVETVTYQAGTLVYVFNKKQGLGSNLYFRQAVNAAINSKDILTGVYGNLFDMGSSYMDATQPFWYSNAGEEHYNIHDLNLAKELLQKSGYKGETFRILTSPIANMDRGALVLQQQLEAIGIKSELITFDWATHMAYRVDPSGYDIYTTSYSTVPVPSLKLYYAIAEPGWPEDATLQKYLADFNSATSRDDARARWEILQAYSWEHIPAINLGHYVACFAWSKKVENLSVYNGLYFWNASVRK